MAIVNPLRILAMTQRAKMPGSTRMDAACGASSNLVVRDFFVAVSRLVRSGTELATAFAAERWRIGGIGDNLAAQATITKRTGGGADILDDLANTIEEDAEARIITLSRLLEPLVTIVVLAMVFFAFAAVYSVQIQLLFEYLNEK
jgi:type II secretory pathway component PulF